MSGDKENLKFKITLSGTFWNNPPKYSIWIDDTLIKQSQISKNSNEYEVIEFNLDLEESTHALKIKLENKTNSDTIVENNQIIKDTLLNIESIEIDDMDLEKLKWSSQYLLDSPQEYQGKIIDHLDHCVNLGWNGTYILEFSTPFYIWLLENL